MNQIYCYLALFGILAIGAVCAADVVSKRRQGAGFFTAFLFGLFFTPIAAFLYGLMFPEKK